MQDLIQGQSGRPRSIRNISIDRPQTTESTPPPPPPIQNDTVFKEPTGGSPIMMSRSGFIRPKGPKRKLWWTIGGVALILVLLFVFGTIFAGATVNLTPRAELVNLDTTFTAYKAPAPGQVGFEIITVERESSRSVVATGEEKIERPASGRIMVYNNFDGDPQKLIKNTRFQTPDGKVFRIQESITVPGKVGNTPGSVEAEVFADSAGTEYNIGLSDFTIPGFKEGGDMDRFNGFYARSKTEMTGGFSGTVKTASEADTEKANNEMEAELTVGLMEDAEAAIPENFVLLPESKDYSFDPLPNTEGQDGQVVLRMKGSVRLMAVGKDVVASAAAVERISGYTGEPVTFIDTEGLTFQIVTTPFDLTSASSTDIRVTGPTTLVWTFDVEALASELAGKARSKTAQIFAKYPGIEKADVVVRPFWKRSLPGSF
jgi:hypothetical protein